MKKSAIITLIILAIAAVFAIIRFAIPDTLDTAISKYESGSNVRAIEILNQLASKTDYEKSEKIYFYKCKAVNSLAREIEKDYSDELQKVSLENKGSPDFEKYKNKIDTKLKKINDKTGADLTLIILNKKSSIISGGKFYGEFVLKYRGSPYIEDLDFEELHKIASDKLLNALSKFYARYPNTSYLAQIVKMIFDIMQSGSGIVENEKFILKAIGSYVRKFPSAAETGRIFMSKADNVNLRNSPGVEGKPVGKTVKGEILIQLEKSMDTTQIGDTRDYWYRVSTLKGLKGWIFGKFLIPSDITKTADITEDETWTLEENFTEWDDSSTPKSWSQVNDSYKSPISFTAVKNSKILRTSPKQSILSGLFKKYNFSKAFTVSVRARHISGKSVSIFALSYSPDKVYILRLSQDSAEICGRNIPINGSDWHEYKLESMDGNLASFYIDGELISARIPSVKSQFFTLKGIYIMHSSPDDTGSAEMEYFKLR
jgi:hypothetical protein